MKTESTLLCIVALCWTMYLAGCGGGNAASPQPVPAPTISSLSPSSATAGGPQFTLTVTRANFMPGYVVTWNGSSRATTFVSSTQLSATILASDIAMPGNAFVRVTTSLPNVSSGNDVAFVINAANPMPSLSTARS